MTKFVIERQFLTPIVQYRIIQADSLEEACEKAVDDDDRNDAHDSDQRDTTINHIRVLREGYHLNALTKTFPERDRRIDALARFVYSEDTGPDLTDEMPVKYVSD